MNLGRREELTAFIRGVVVIITGIIVLYTCAGCGLLETAADWTVKGAAYSLGVDPETVTVDRVVREADWTTIGGAALTALLGGGAAGAAAMAKKKK